MSGLLHRSTRSSGCRLSREHREWKIRISTELFRKPGAEMVEDLGLEVDG